MRERVCAAIIKDNAILMVHHQHGGKDYWTLPGGAPEPGETPGEAVAREVREETGLNTRVVRLLWEERLQTEVTVTFERCFLIETVDEREPVLGVDPELSEDRQILKDVAWFPLENVRDDIMVSRVLQSLGETTGGRSQG